ncbi:MAG: DUF2520 domain-containing protein [Myxococcales bacterium]|nr:DUF2520 domain-containing protein [Myxococcales bacterium]
MSKRSPNTFVIGAGPVATALAGSLRRAGVPVLGLWARRPEAARAAARTAGVAGFSSAPPDLILEADVVVVAVSDSAIAEVAAKVCGTGLITRRHVLLHCSGAVAAGEVLGGVAAQVGGVGTLHPLRAISDPSLNLRGTVFGVEGDPVAVDQARYLVERLGGVALSLEREQMAAYHAAAAMASNFVVTLVDAAARALAATGMPMEQATAALVPLAQGALTNVAEQGAAQGLTGPIRRGDFTTVQRHLEALKVRPGALELYRALGRATVELAASIPEVEGGPPAAALEEIRRALG